MSIQQFSSPELDYPVIAVDLYPAAGCGVYIFINYMREVLYIGSSTRMWRRVASHLAATEKAAWVEGIVTFIPTPTIVDARRIERQLIEKYRPTWNVALKPQRHRTATDDTEIILHAMSKRGRKEYVKAMLRVKGESTLGRRDVLNTMFEQLPEPPQQQQRQQQRRRQPAQPLSVGAETAYDKVVAMFNAPYNTDDTPHTTTNVNRDDSKGVRDSDL